MNFDKKADICIVSGDKDFARLLAYEASKAGFCADIRGEILESDAALYKLFVIDLDRFGENIPSDFGAMMLGYSTLYSHEGLLDLGKLCDGVLHKPFLMSDYRSVLSALIAPYRNETAPFTQTPRENDVQFFLDADKREAVVYGESVALSEKEFYVLELLLENRGRVLSRTEIAMQIACEGNVQEVDVYICFLRRKIDDRLNTKLIRTVRGVGYVIR